LGVTSLSLSAIASALAGAAEGADRRADLVRIDEVAPLENLTGANQEGAELDADGDGGPGQREAAPAASDKRQARQPIHLGFGKHVLAASFSVGQ